MFVAQRSAIPGCHGHVQIGETLGERIVSRSTNKSTPKSALLVRRVLWLQRGTYCNKINSSSGIPAGSSFLQCPTSCWASSAPALLPQTSLHPEVFQWFGDFFYGKSEGIHDKPWTRAPLSHKPAESSVIQAEERSLTCLMTDCDVARRSRGRRIPSL